LKKIGFNYSKRRQFEKIFQPYLHACYNLARYLSGNTHDAEDIVQEAYIKAYRSFEGFNPENTRAWILTITRNSCYSWMRKHYKNLDISLDDESIAQTHKPLQDMAKSPEYLAQSHVNQQLIRQSIASLPMVFREVAVLRELEELSYAEISQILDIPKGTVMSRIARARKKLCELLINLDENDYEL
jgi:RNA polymerase sigma-70 factor (ECF subfamily)